MNSRHRSMETSMTDLRDADPVGLFVRNQNRFRRFLRSRVDSEAAVDDILQSAYLKGLERGSQLKSGESAVAWFYRILRNSIADHHRKSNDETRRFENVEKVDVAGSDPRFEVAVCQCVKGVLAGLKGKYAIAVERVDLDGMPVEEFARREGISANNASVRLHRARKALSRQLIQTCGVCAEHKCFDCSCR